MELRFGWLVEPDMEASARSTTSTCASFASSTEAAATPLVSCVWKWTGRPISSFKRLHQLIGGVRTAHAGHVLDGEEMRAHFFQFLRQLDVIFEGILGALRVEDVAGVTNCRLANGVGFLHRFHGHLQIRRVIERIKDAENINALCGGVLDEAGHDVVGIIGITDGVGAAEEHLETDVRHLFAQGAQPQPRVFVQKTHARCRRSRRPTFPG